MAELWHWLAVYQDGSQVREEDDVPFADVAQDQLAAFVLLPQRPHLAAAAVRLVHPGSRVRFFRRRHISLDPQTRQQTTHDGLHVLGIAWPDGRSACTFLYADGSVLLSDDVDVTDGLGLP
jgi:hypothetical protein